MARERPPENQLIKPIWNVEREDVLLKLGWWILWGGLLNLSFVSANFSLIPQPTTQPININYIVQTNITVYSTPATNQQNLTNLLWLLPQGVLGAVLIEIGSALYYFGYKEKKRKQAGWERLTAEQLNAEIERTAKEGRIPESEINRPFVHSAIQYHLYGNPSTLRQIRTVPLPKSNLIRDRLLDGFIELRRKNGSKAVEIFREAQNMEPKNAIALWGIALAFEVFNKEAYAEEIARYKRAALAQDSTMELHRRVAEYVSRAEAADRQL
jgi:prepilin signal peptidase PulO-like enzyme (type II secretory pathway)